MARKLRIQYAGAIYHVMNRGDRSDPIFEDDQDRHRLLEALGQACEKTGWQVHAYCLMGNHFHFVVKIPALTFGWTVSTFQVSSMKLSNLIRVAGVSSAGLPNPHLPGVRRPNR